MTTNTQKSIDQEALRNAKCEKCGRNILSGFWKCPCDIRPSLITKTNEKVSM